MLRLPGLRDQSLQGEVVELHPLYLLLERLLDDSFAPLGSDVRLLPKHLFQKVACGFHRQPIVPD